MVSCLLTLSIQRSKHAMHWMLCLSRLSILLSKHIHTFQPITFLIFNGFFNLQKVLESWELGLFNHTIKYYICQYCQYKTRISNAFNAIYVDTVNTVFTSHSTLYKVLCKSHKHQCQQYDKHSIKCIACFDLHIDSVNKQDTLLNIQ